MPPPDLLRQLSRFKRLPESQDVWEGAIAAMPTWVDAPDGTPYRPQAIVWASTSRQLANLKLLDEAAADEVALAAFVEMGTSAKLAGYRPRAVRVQDARLADMLRDPLAGLAIPIDVVDTLPAVGAFVTAKAENLTETPVPAALDAPGVTPARLAAFADAAKRFFDAAPWRHLQDGDLIKVEKPKAGRGLALCGVLGKVCCAGPRTRPRPRWIPAGGRGLSRPRKGSRPTCSRCRICSRLRQSGPVPATADRWND